MTISHTSAFIRAGAVLTVSALAVGTLAACGRNSGSGGGGSHSIVYLSPVASQPGQQDIFWAMQKAGKSLGWSVSQTDANLSPDKQVAGVDTAITQQKSAIASWSLDPDSVAAAYKRARNAGIPVVGVNSPGGNVDTEVLWQNATCPKGGVQDQTARYLAKLKPGGNIALISGPPTPSGLKTLACFRNYLKADGLKIVAATANTQDSSDAASRIAADLLTAHPDIDAIWTYNDSTALGSSSAVVSAHKKVASAADPADGIVVIGSNADKDALQAIKQHRLTATWDPDNIATGYAIVYQMKQLLAGKKTVPSVTIPALLVDSSNVAKQANARARTYTLSDFPGLDGASS